MAFIRTFTHIPNTYESLAWKIEKLIPTNCTRVDLVADRYNENSIKSTERLGGGIGDKVEIKSADSKIPANFHFFLKSIENEPQMMRVISTQR